MDRFGRTIDHLRLSVTSACNLRCLYCRPGKTLARRPSEWMDLQRIEFVRFLCDTYGLSQLRLTGGEPLLHNSILSLISSIRQIAPLLTIAMTTNGARLAGFAGALRSAGLNRLNISLDTLDAGRYRALTGGHIKPVLEGIESTMAVGFPPPRVNVVVLRKINDDELVRLTIWAFERGIEIRFLEAMPIGPASYFNRQHFVSADEIRRILTADFELKPMDRGFAETATRYSVVDRQTGKSGVLGIIAPLSERFCAQCRRIRVTASGQLFPCLLDSRSVDLCGAWQNGRFSRRELTRLIHHAVAGKRAAGPLDQLAGMVQLGG